MTSLNKNETSGTANRMKNYALFEFLSETILECCGPVEWPVSQTFTNVEKTVIMLMLFVVKVVVISGPTTTDAKDVKEPLGFRLMSVRIISISFGDGTPRERVLPQEIGRIYRPRGSEARPEWVFRETAPVNPFRKHCRLPIFSGSGFPFLNAVRSIQS
jgi:hypothetical protein